MKKAVSDQQLDPLRSEGDLNLSPRRAAWAADHLDEATQALLREDDRYFLHQSLSTPCLNVLRACDGIYIEDYQGRRIMDFHGNWVHQVGFRNPRVIAAITEQMQTLPFCTRRYTNVPAIDLAKKLATLAPGALNKVLLVPGGALAMGMALKLARMATGRFKTISMWTLSTAPRSTSSPSAARRSSVATSAPCCPVPNMCRRPIRAPAPSAANARVL